jgi:hypothetical protein
LETPAQSPPQQRLPRGRVLGGTKSRGSHDFEGVFASKFPAEWTIDAKFCVNCVI